MWQVLAYKYSLNLSSLDLSEVFSMKLNFLLNTICDKWFLQYLNCDASINFGAPSCRTIQQVPVRNYGSSFNAHHILESLIRL